MALDPDRGLFFGTAADLADQNDGFSVRIGRKQLERVDVRGADERIAADAGYVCMEFAKELPYYAGAFGAAIFTDSISSNEAIVFLGGANLGAGVYEYGLARLVRAFLQRATPS